MDSSISRQCYRLLLRLYPAPFREAHGSEMEAVFMASLRIKRRRWGKLGFPISWARVLADTVWHALRLRLRRGGPVQGRGRPSSYRPGRTLRFLREDARSAARHLRRNGAFTVTAVATLALGIGLNTAVFGAVYSLLLRPLPGVGDPQGLVHVYRTRGMDARFLPSSIPLLRDLQSNGDVFSGLAAWTFSSVSAHNGERAERVLAQIVSGEFFEVLGVPMLRGRGFLGEGGEEGPQERVVVVSERYWRGRMGGAPGVVGRTLEINGDPWEIIGIAPGEFRGPIPVAGPVFWVPLSLHPQLMRGADESENRGNNFLEVVARLRPGVTHAQAGEWAEGFAAQLQEAYPALYEDMGVRIHPQEAAGIHPAIRSAQAGFSGVVMALVALLLLVACVNVASLFLAKAQTRGREVAVRRSLGSARRRLVSQFLLESLFLSLLAGAAGFLLAWVLVDLLNRVRIPSAWFLEWNIVLDGPVLAFNLCVTLLASLVFGLVPALRSSNPDLVSSLKGRGTSGGRKQERFGRVLVGAQVAVSTVLLVCAGLFGKNLKDALAVDTGFRHEGLALATLDPGFLGYGRDEVAGVFRVLMERARAVPGVESVALARYLPLGVEGAQRLVQVPGYQPSRDESMNIQLNVVGPGYFASMGIPVLEGRGFLESDAGAETRAAVVNRRFADRFWPGRSPIGEAFQAGGDTWEVVGVVPTGKYQRLGEEPLAFLYLPWPAMHSDQMTIHVRTALDPATILPTLRREFEAAVPGVPVDELKTMEDHLAFALLPARLGAILLGAFGGICLFLLCVGIHGVVAYSVSRRTREVGIRVALGAEPGSATALVLGDESRVVLTGILLGLGAAMAASRALGSLLYSRNALDPWVLAAAPLLLVAVATVASYLPARRAARVDPAQALREE